MSDTSNNFGGQIDQIRDAVTSGVPVKVINLTDTQFNAMFPNFGDIAYRIQPRTNFNLSVSGGTSNQYQTIKFIVQQPPKGNCEISFDSSIIWITKPAFIDSRIGSFCFFDVFTFDGGRTYYGRQSS